MTAPMTITNCPTDPNLMAAFIDGRLDGDERRTVIEHMTTCAECRDVFMTANELAEQSGEVVPLRRRSWLVPAATLAAAAAIGAVVFLGPVAEWRRMRALVQAAGEVETRPVEGRFSVDMPHKNYVAYRGAGDAKSTKYRLLAAASDLAATAERNDSVGNLHRAGIAYLMLENTKEINYKKHGVDLLQRALLKQTSREAVEPAIAAATDADLLNDLAVGYHAMGAEERARLAAERAWTLEKSPATAWTRAVILRTDAAWNDYFVLDPGSPWRDEAVKRYTGN
jgi:hypothetical protein